MSACTPNLWPYDYTQGTEVIFLMIVINSLIKTANKEERIVFFNILREETIPH